MMATPPIRVQEKPFDVGAELAALSDGRTDIGAVASFTGLVRDMANVDEAGVRRVSALTLEHYPGMTEKSSRRSRRRRRAAGRCRRR